MLNATDLNNSISFSGVGKTYSKESAPALRDINFSVAKGQFICLIGPSGGGKSTVLKLIAGLEKPTSGSLQTPPRANIGMVFQSGALFPWLSAVDNVVLVLQVHNPRLAKIHARREALEFLDMVNLGAFADKMPAELSGGQRQRVGIARALAVRPHVLLLDEPFSALDPKTTYELHRDLLRLWKATGITVVMVSHLIEEAVSLAETVLLIKNGTVAERYVVEIPYPRRDQEAAYIHEVQNIRKAFFA